MYELAMSLFGRSLPLFRRNHDAAKASYRAQINQAMRHPLPPVQTSLLNKVMTNAGRYARRHGLPDTWVQNLRAHANRTAHEHAVAARADSSAARRRT